MSFFDENLYYGVVVKLMGPDPEEDFSVDF